MQTRRRQRKQSGGVSHKPKKTRKHASLRSRVIGRNTIIRARSRGSKGTEVLGLQRPNISIFFEPEMGSLENSISAYKALLNLYENGEGISDKVADDILTFLIFVNSEIREKAADLEGDLRIHFSDSTVDDITDTDDATDISISRKSKECISFLKKLHKKTRTEKDVRDKRELMTLSGKFNDIIITSMREARALFYNVKAAAANIEMGAAPAAAAAEEEAPSNTNLDKLMEALGKMGV